MKRDMELVRLLLIHYEGEEEVDLSKYPTQQQFYHVKKMIEAGLIDGKVEHVFGPASETVYQPPSGLMVLTWYGHDFLDAAKNQAVWKKAMGKVRESGGTVAFEVLKALLVAYGRDLVGLS